jgi:hypothetical protein
MCFTPWTFPVLLELPTTMGCLVLGYFHQVFAVFKCQKTFVEYRVSCKFTQKLYDMLNSHYDALHQRDVTMLAL